MRAIRRNVARKGFTLIELMIVIAIIGVLAAIAVPSFSKAREKANLRACHANQKTIAGAIEMYNLDNGVSVKTLDDGVGNSLVTGGYLSSLVDDPGSGPNSFKNYQLTDKNAGITCTVHGALMGGKPDGAAVASAGSSGSTNG